MKQHATPLTDAACGKGSFIHCVDDDFARDLERQLADANVEIKRLRNSLTELPEAARTESFTHDLNGKVLIHEINRPGRITALIIDSLGVQYQVSYWLDGERKSTWLHGDELRSMELSR